MPKEKNKSTGMSTSDVIYTNEARNQRQNESHIRTGRAISTLTRIYKSLIEFCLEFAYAIALPNANNIISICIIMLKLSFVMMRVILISLHSLI